MSAYQTALTLLARRDLSAKQLRDRLVRRKFDRDDIDKAITRLLRDKSLDDHRVALASAHLEASVRRHGRRRVLQHVQQLGISGAVAKAAVDQVFEDVDETALLDDALARRLKGGSARELDAKGVARVVRSLVGQGFDAHDVYARLRKRGAEVDE